MNNEMEIVKTQIKDNIQYLVDNNKIDEAMGLIEEYFKIDSEDIEIYSMRAVVLIMKDRIDEAENILKEGLNIDSGNFDLNYNLAYLYDLKENFHHALKYYKKALEACKDEELKSNLSSFIKNYSSEHDIVDVVVNRKIVFFVKQGMDSFIGDVINGLPDNYEIKKVIVTDYKQIDEGMEWADICWFEWCDELVSYGSNHKLAVEKKILCRLHSYEAFTNYPSNVNWNNVDKLILVAEHIRKVVIDKFKINESKTVVITNGIDIKKWSFDERKPGFNIAYVGYIDYKKGPMLLLHTFKAIYDKDHRYKLYIAGQFKDDRDVLYYNQMIREFGLENNVIYEGWQNNLDKWLEDKNYILCTSVLESQNISVMQAMAKGIKPIVHNFVGARNIYESKYIFNTIDEAVEKILSLEYDSKDYFNFIKNKYLLEDKLDILKNIILSVSNKEKEGFNYKEYWNNRLNSKFDIEGVGYIGLGQIYNNFLYKSRFEILDFIVEKLFCDLGNRSVLELGPGIGMFTEYFYKNNTDKYCAIDISEKSQKELSEKFKKFKFVLGDISEKKYYPKDKYDLIFAADVLLHLTDEKKYKALIKNLSSMLTDEGFMVIFDPITMINSKSVSPHLVIRDFKYIEEILKVNDLEVVGMMPSAFFMNYPFDKDIIKDKSVIAQDTFNLIQSVFSSSEILDNTKRDLAEWLSLLDKECLITNKFGLSQKVIIVKKKTNKVSIDFSINDVWDYSDIKSQINNKKKILNKNKQISKYKLIDLFENNIKNFSRTKHN